MQKLLSAKYRILTTLDGSPTLEFKSQAATENMHNFHGAFSETDYIYGEALRMAIKENFSLSVLSIGLGLGYNEIMTACYTKAHGLPVSLDSYEIDGFLKTEFLNWVGGGNSSALDDCYNTILDLFAQKLDLESSECKEHLASLAGNQKFKFQNEFNIYEAPETAYSVLFYDPFSAKTNPDFWSEGAITAMLLKLAAPQCVFTTYAATGALKRALRAAEFELHVRPGFGGKRQSFLAVRGAGLKSKT